MKSIFARMIDENAAYTFEKIGSKWYVKDIEGGYTAGSGFITKKAAMQFMANLEEKVRR